MINFNKLVEAHLFREQKAKQIGRYYPSEIGSCMRKVWYSYKRPQQISVDTLKIFEAGNIIHGFVVEVFKSEKNKDVQLLHEELPFKHQEKDFVISGRIDDLVLLKDKNEKVLVEVKSAKSIDMHDKASVTHEMQLLLYMHLLEIHKGVVLYVDKTNLNSKVFEVPYDAKRAEQVISRFKKLDTCLKGNELPEAEARQLEEMNWMCRFCEYAEVCEKNEQ